MSFYNLQSRKKSAASTKKNYSRDGKKPLINAFGKNATGKAKVIVAKQCHEPMGTVHLVFRL
ncbi:hypothetical protein [Bartonella tribocorum]|uniref:Uncharacterized protein n=1 Tax=Bartonella tribocorum TaxID=85701 RepID=A0A2M6UVD0_9HYPH|nr:hypothetical protein [Bartonella tribocorum]PIT70141.1 hypothetical protein CER18_00010 [Bartonella tribocorum]